MSDSVKISVVVPVYNASDYLEQCLESICNQTFREIEIICVDDGSTDDSPAILRDFCTRDSRLRVISQKNLYAGVARNAGKAVAKGEYLVFWDADDYFYETALEKMFLQIETDQADICVCGGARYYNDLQIEAPATHYVSVKRLPEVLPFNRLTNPDYILNFTNEVPWNKMFRRSFIEEQQLDFQPVRNGNDVYFVINALCLADRITVVPEPLVCYRKNMKESLVGSVSKSPLTPFQAWIDAKNNLQAKGCYPQKSFENKVLDSIFYLLRNMCTSWPAFQTAVRFLRDQGEEGLGLEIREDDYYYVPWYRETLTHMLQDTPEDFLAFFLHLTFIQLTESTARRQLQTKKNSDKKRELKNRIDTLKQEKKQEKQKWISEKETLLRRCETAEKEAEKLRTSWSYRIGHLLMWLPGKLKTIFRGNA